MVSSNLLFNSCVFWVQYQQHKRNAQKTMSPHATKTSLCPSIVTGALIYVNPDTGDVTGYDDVFTKLEKARDWYEECGLGRDYAEQFIR
jgi:hypothetical protein